MNREIIVTRDAAELSTAAAETFASIASEAIRQRRTFTVALSGGSTPKSLYRRLSSEPFTSSIEWRNIRFFFSDERNVPASSFESNYRLAKDFLFTPLDVTGEQVFPWKTDIGDPPSTAADYSESVRRFVRSETSEGLPEFDLVLLGMGADGHTASLFPFTPALKEANDLAAENWVESLGSWRFTMTYPLINASKNVVFLVSGSEKAETLQRVLASAGDCESLPSRCVSPARGKLIWLIDAEAAASLDKNTLIVHNRPVTNYN